MNFWDLKNPDSQAEACYCEREGRPYTYEDLSGRVESAKSEIRTDRKGVVLLLCDNSFSTLLAYLATLQSRQAAMLLPHQIELELLSNILSVYVPEYIWDVSSRPKPFNDYEKVGNIGRGTLYRCKLDTHSSVINPDLALMLSTSGTTGSPKFVRLSYKNLQANSESITAYMHLTNRDAAITSLPFSYSYGLSVVNSHLLAGGKLVCTNASIVTAPLWELFKTHACTFFAGVPFTFETLRKLRFERMVLPSLRLMTQAGGRLSVDTIKHFADLAQRMNFEFFVMYGQTEATARISYVPLAEVRRKAGSIGIAIPGGALTIQKDGIDVTEPDVDGEIVYSGPNVMMGYAECRADLSRDDELHGILKTGDTGYKDADGYFFVTGRLKRFIKIHGLRVNLDEVERILESRGFYPVACVGSDDSLLILLQAADREQAGQVREVVVELFKLHHSVVHARVAASLPVTGNGKKDYDRIKREWTNVNS